jgi:hypothetical protein
MSTTLPTVTRPAGRPTGRQIAEGFGAAAVLATGLAGIPAALGVAVGWPLPRQVPTGGQIGHALRSPIPDSFWPHLFATLGWLAWIYFVLCVATIVVVHLRGQQHTWHPRLGQAAAAGLVSAVMVLGQFRGTPAGRTSAPVPVVQLVADTTAAASVQPTAVTHTVLAGDTLWGIAATYYGSGIEWQAIYQANVGVPQPGGGALGDAHWIYPGWVLVIPGVDAPPVVAAPAPPSTSPVPAPVVPITASGGHDISIRPLPSARRVGPAKSGTPSAAVHRLRPAARVAPTMPRPAARRAPAVRHDTARRRPSGPGAGSATHRVTASAHDDEIGTVALGGGIFGVTAVGLVAALDRRRRRQSGRRAPGMHIPLPAPHSPLADLELRLRHHARADRLFWLARLPDLLAQGAGTPRPDVTSVRVLDQGLEILVAPETGEPRVPFENRPGDPAVWYLPYDADPGVADNSVLSEPPPLTLVTVGHGDNGTLLVNLDHYGSIHIQVAADQVPGTLAAIAAELAGTTAPEAVTVIAIGVGHGVIDRLGSGVVTDDVDAVLTHSPSGEEAIVLIDAASLTGALAELAARTAGLRLVTAGPVAPAGTGLVVDPAAPILSDHELDPVEPAQVTRDTLAQVGALLDLAEAPTDVRPGDQPYGQFAGRVASLNGPPTGPITIGIFGEPTIAVGDGASQDLLDAVSATAGTKARRVVELLVYLAAHGGTATRGEWLTDISPDKALSDGYVRNLVLLTRRSLEAVAGDPDLLVYDRATQRLNLTSKVRTDWAMLRTLTTSGQPEELRAALSLVRGVPFGVNPEPWTSAAGISYVIIDDIVDAAAVFGEHALSIGDQQLATWAVRQGQLANRYDQGLWRILLRAAGDNPGRQRVWQELHALLAVDGNPVDDLDPATVDLYHVLNVSRPTASEVVVLQGEDDAVIPTRRAV